MAMRSPIIEYDDPIRPGSIILNREGDLLEAIPPLTPLCPEECGGCFLCCEVCTPRESTSRLPINMDETEVYHRLHFFVKLGEKLRKDLKSLRGGETPRYYEDKDESDWNLSTEETTQAARSYLHHGAQTKLPGKKDGYATLYVMEVHTPSEVHIPSGEKEVKFGWTGKGRAKDVYARAEKLTRETGMLHLPVHAERIQAPPKGTPQPEEEKEALRMAEERAGKPTRGKEWFHMPLCEAIRIVKDAVRKVANKRQGKH